MHFFANLLLLLRLSFTNNNFVKLAASTCHRSEPTGGGRGTKSLKSYGRRVERKTGEEKYKV